MLPLLPQTLLILASAMTCPDITPEISVRLVQGETKIIRAMSREQLTIMKQGKDNQDWRLESDDVYVQGLGGGELGLSGAIQFSMSYDRNNQGCIALEHIRGEITTKPEIHIASNYPRGSCEYNAILEHEEKHIRILQEFAAEYRPRYEAKLQRLASTMPVDGPMPRSQVKPAHERKHERISGAIEEYSHTLMQLLRQRQFAIDTEAEYARVRAQCENWLNPHRIPPQNPRYNQ